MEFSTPAYHNHEEFQNRLKKLEEIKELGINPILINFLLPIFPIS